MSMFRTLNPRPALTRIRNAVTFQVERLLLRGTIYRLLVIGLIIVIVSVSGGLLLFFTHRGLAPVEEGNPALARPGSAVWWAFLRMTDPGYLGDDTGGLTRFISTIITVIGYVLFTGALIAAMTQWLHETISNLEKGLTPVQRRNHIVILGWTNRTPALVREIMQSEARVKRFLQRHNAKRLSIVILAEDVRSELATALKEELGELYSQMHIILRSGTPLRLDHLNRVAFLDAASIVLPGAELASQRGFAADANTVKTILTIGNAVRRGSSPPPFVLAEIFDARRTNLARAAYSGHVEVLASDVVISRALTQTVRHRGLSLVFNEILTLGLDNEILIPESKGHGGRNFRELESAFPRGVLLGALRRTGNELVPHLNPSDDFILEESDQLVILARSFDDCQMVERATSGQLPGGRVARQTAETRRQRVLVLGWNLRAVALLTQFDSYTSETFAIDLFSRVPIAARERAMADYNFKSSRLEITHFEADYVLLSDLARLDLASYDNVLFLASDRYESEEEADARTILGYLLLVEMLEKVEKKPAVLVELMDAENEALFEGRPAEIIISPLILSHIMSQVTLRPELFAVFEELLGTRGPEISFHDFAEYGLEGREVTFPEIKDAVAARGEIALGVRIEAQRASATRGIFLNPINGESWRFTPGDELVVLVTNYA